MSKKPRTPRSAESLSNSLPHIEYEVDMLEFCHQALRDMRNGGHTNDRNVYLEGFGLHARALVGFLFKKNDADDMFADDFVRDEVEWKKARGGLPECLKPVHSRVGTEMAHLVYDRAGIGPEARLWNTEPIARELRRLMEVFREHVSGDIARPVNAPVPSALMLNDAIGVGTTALVTNTTLSNYFVVCVPPGPVERPAHPVAAAIYDLEMDAPAFPAQVVPAPSAVTDIATPAGDAALDDATNGRQPR